MPFDAVNVMGNVPLAVGVPLKTPALKVTPAGSAPDSVIVGAGNPVAVTVNDPAAPSVNVVLLALVMAGACLMVSVKFCTALGKTPFDAVNVIGNVPLAVGVPLKTPALKVTPLGSAPDSVMVGAGDPTAVTVNEPGAPWVTVGLLALVMTGA